MVGILYGKQHALVIYTHCNLLSSYVSNICNLQFITIFQPRCSRTQATSYSRGTQNWEFLAILYLLHLDTKTH